MKHAVIYDNCGNKWDTALPLGNSVFGCMVFYEDHILHMPMNHYEVYHYRRSNSIPQDSAYKLYQTPHTTRDWHQERIDEADRKASQNGEPYVYYRPGYERTDVDEKTHAKGAAASYAHPATGELKFHFADALKDVQNKITLYTEDAKTELLLKGETDSLSMETIIAREDCILSRFEQSRSGLLESIRIDFSPYPKETSPSVVYTQIDDATFGYTATRQFTDEDAKTFVFSGIIRLVGARGTLAEEVNGTRIVITESEKDVTVMTGIFTDWKYENPLDDGVKKMDEFQSNLPMLYADHSAYWKEFFARSSVSLPDPFLEHVYYVNQYALDCSSGKDGIMKHQACGLNGLWGIRNPYIWYSTWYWDVNIQAAFAGVFSSNRLDLGKVFSDGLKCYVDSAKWFAEEYHRMTGISADYPYHFYYSTWPWCAMYLWFQYEYSQDVDYLREDAYPIFLKICEFLVQLYRYDEEKGYCTIYPDISPEQGPLTHDTTITTASVKYLFQFTLKSAEILGDTNPLLAECKKILGKMCPYATCEDTTYGKRFKDSHDAPANMWIRHPSMMMPLFPIGEYDMDSDEEIRTILENSVHYLEDRCEMGIFGGSWLAACAARLGKGQTALRLLYERGIDHVLRSSGLSAEETDRFMNFCLLNGGPRFYPDMMEFTGQMLAVVNEMLLQSHNDIIRIFSALPDGDPEIYRMHIHGYSNHEYPFRFRKYDAWKTVRFDKLLAKGAFEVSASLKDGTLEWILVHSKKGGKVRISCPFLKDGYFVTCNGKGVPVGFSDGIMSFDTVEGEFYLIAISPDAYQPKDENEAYNTDILSRKTYTKRNLFIGENTDTEYYKAMDYFLRSWYLANIRMENHTLHKFDFCVNKEKPYLDYYSPQSYGACEMLMVSNPFQVIGSDNLTFDSFRGYGFCKTEGITFIDRGKPDLLRQDFIQGTEETEFIIDAPRGQYEFLVVSGDLEEENITILEMENGARYGGEVVKKGRYQCELIPFVQKKDTPIRLKISTKPGYQWKMNLLMLNVTKGY